MKENWQVNGVVAIASGVAWVASFLAHNHFLAFLNHAPGIDLLFIPSGIRMLALLIGGGWAAVGISLGSLFLTGAEFQTMHPGTILAVALCSGFCPYLALRLSLSLVGVGRDLGNLSPARLPLISLGVAAGSALLHNLLFAVLGLAAWHAFWGNTLAMMAGDFLGILLAVVAVYAARRALRFTSS